MKIRRIFMIVFAFFAATAVMWTQSAFSYPEYSQTTGRTCSYCHTDPAGGEELTAAGQYYKTNNTLEGFEETQPAPPAVTEPAPPATTEPAEPAVPVEPVPDVTEEPELVPPAVTEAPEETPPAPPEVEPGVEPTPAPPVETAPEVEVIPRAEVPAVPPAPETAPPAIEAPAVTVIPTPAEPAGVGGAGAFTGMQRLPRTGGDILSLILLGLGSIGTGIAAYRRRK